MKKVKNTFFIIIKGVMISIIITIICLLILSLLLSYTSLSEEFISPSIIVITGISILIGSFMGNKKIEKNGMLNGGIIGLIYILTIYALSSIITKTLFNFNVESIIMCISGIIGGMIGGIIGINIKNA